MTLPGKCDTCRKRKVKCDEKRPICTACMKKHRPCRYQVEKTALSVNVTVGEQLLPIMVEQTSEARTVPLSKRAILAMEDEESNDDVLRLKSVHRTEDIHGLYLTFKRPRTSKKKPLPNVAIALRASSQPKTLLRQQDNVVKRWASVFGFESLDLNPLGEWLRAAWLAIDNDTAVKDACHFALSSMELFQHRTDKTLNRAYLAGARAIASLQIAVRTCSCPEQIQNLILAIFLHSAAEHFIKIGSFNYVAHFLGAGKLLNVCRAMGGREEFVTMIARSTCMDEMMEAILDGREYSIFESACREPIITSSAESWDIETAMRAVQYILAQLPRLVFQARKATQEVSESTSVRDVIEGAVALFSHKANSYVEHTIETGRKTIEKDSDVQSFEGLRLDAHILFNDVRMFYLTLGYNFAQMILCGLMQQLGETHMSDPATPMLDIVAARARDLAAARSIAECVSYALQPTPSLPFKALAVLAPLQLSIGTWVRLQRRQCSTSTWEYTKAAEMLDWVLKEAGYIVDMWQSAPTTIERMTVCCEMFAGGPYIPNRGLPK